MIHPAAEVGHVDRVADTSLETSSFILCLNSGIITVNILLYRCFMDNTNYDAYSKILTKSVNHIFKKFLNDALIQEVFESQAGQNDTQVAVEIDGTLKGEVVINIPQKTLSQISKHFIGDSKAKLTRSIYADVAGELANMITGTFANLMQYANHEIKLSPPEFNDDPITIKALYDNVNMSFNSSFGGFDIDLYYRDN